MKNEDILTLAKAGFTANQIAALNMVGTNQAQVAQGTGGLQIPPAGNGNPAADMLNIMQMANLLNASQPPAQTTDDILASIINPPAVVTPQNGGQK